MISKLSMISFEWIKRDYYFLVHVFAYIEQLINILLKIKKIKIHSLSCFQTCFISWGLTQWSLYKISGIFQTKYIICIAYKLYFTRKYLYIMTQHWFTWLGADQATCFMYYLNPLGWRALKTPTSETPDSVVTWPRSRFNTSGPDPLGFDWEDLAASRGTVGGHSGHPPIK